MSARMSHTHVIVVPSAQVGLCLLDPAADLPPEWGFSRGDLPPIGASPDAMLRHAGGASPCLLRAQRLGPTVVYNDASRE